MPYGLFTRAMQDEIEPFVRGREVWDLGAGDLGYSRTLVRLGATRVLAIDKAWDDPPTPPPGVELRAARFEEVAPPAEGYDVAFLSWPQNTRLPGLIPLLAVARTVVYLGSNVDGTACGDLALFSHLTARTVVLHVPHRRNSLTVYSAEVAGPGRLLTGEEFAAIHGQENVISFEEAVRAAARGIVSGT